MGAVIKYVCDICNKEMIKKSIARHKREVHKIKK